MPSEMGRKRVKEYRSGAMLMRQSLFCSSPTPAFIMLNYGTVKSLLSPLHSLDWKESFPHRLHPP